MSTERELPMRWAERLIARGYTDRRSTADKPSLGALSDATGVHQTTLKSAIVGARRPSVDTVVALTKALGDDVAEWLGERRPSAWELPAEAELLSDRQQRAIVELIMSMTERREDVGNDDSSAATSQAGESPAPSEAEITHARRRGREDAEISVIAVANHGQPRAQRDYPHEQLRAAYLEGRNSLTEKEAKDLRTAALAASSGGEPSRDELAELRRQQEEADATPAEHIARQAAEHDDEGE